MYQQILHTPEGVRDIYNGECRRKNHVQEILSGFLAKRIVMQPSF